MNKKLFAIPILICCVILALVMHKTLSVPSDPVHIHANFAVFEEGKQVDFTKPEYMHISPCTGDDHESLDPHENVHLHDGVGNVVHVHMAGITWNVLFETLKFDLHKESQQSSLMVYQNKKKVEPSFLGQPIRSNDRILIEIASQSGDIDQEYERVGSNAQDYTDGKIGVEQCGATGPRSLWQRFKVAFTL